MIKGVKEFLKPVSSDPGRIRIDSRKVSSGDVFIAVKGTSRDGHAFIREAVRNGAAAVLCEHIPAGVHAACAKFTVVPDTVEAIGDIAKNIYGDPSSKMRTYGITGTNGKTTTAFLMRHILETAGFRSGLVSTVCTIVSDDIRSRSAMTTPGVMELNSLLSKMFDGGKNAAVIEISSHALAQRRVSGLELDRAVFTNITPEHLDYHKNMEAYFKAKSGIFGILKPGGLGVINADDPMAADVLRSSGILSVVTFGVGRSRDIRAEDIKLSSYGAEFDIVTENYGAIHVVTRLAGKHNVYNILGAAAALLSSDIDITVIARAIETFFPVPGRFERIDHSGAFDVFVDYAHTPDALENVLKCLRGLTRNRLICVFGCGGDRDRSKRPVMGEIASRFADHVILTSDNPRSESPDEILRQIEKGVIARGNHSIIKLRRDAIFLAVAMAGPGDAVIIAGKGHEDYQIIGDRTVHFDDREVAGRALRERGY
ncbi:MAG: UDP-N-acetylmuramoyl-L-alanyl-D-glutamate--2,6-diaminopimelate ligase [Candidatus Omnitrophica bacterium]|nr:UDP-N-acetylmuramoyl-L-alanyl-D-glutamate--2,6-diaminopimelate ligase [Candidatus Omnitrophota bacterium]MBU1128815.1 UDP-N-acetylmuramoyl-L-alanyl-D-glutamate--2,6-diaminopimelate ligase [Candidatus Omnitrophota bacterium]MBU1656659.1 UDP-N-acetylmuramoyl-L-alanyl-D-glutamate--2,6-diaminopimelate ligase [Candidatus Omnitrophota bacterium]MBU1783792.1 UDP-N-acetylmuramoyl-L-alanyl-D-glutamate--2,6-diaminopimelate ligase [Candidatus Omnitrophota bacterium]MBU1851192.1 UDP-N-acetylmuramoyl-L-a